MEGTDTYQGYHQFVADTGETFGSFEVWWYMGEPGPARKPASSLRRSLRVNAREDMSRCMSAP